MLRAIVLSIMMLGTIAATLPIVDTYAGRNQSAASARGRGKRNYHRNRRAWLRRRQARLRQQRALAAMRRREAAMNAMNAFKDDKRAINPNATQVAYNAAPFGFALPKGWSGSTPTTDGGMQFNVRGTDGRDAGAVVLSTVANSSEGNKYERRRRSLGGVAFSELRRRVIDRMVAEGGYVTNDQERTIGGRQAFVVTAHGTRANIVERRDFKNGVQFSASSSTPRDVTYYFVEIDGGIYSFAAETAEGNAAALAAQVEAFVANLRPNQTPTVTAKRSE